MPKKRKPSEPTTAAAKEGDSSRLATTDDTYVFDDGEPKHLQRSLEDITSELTERLPRLFSDAVRQLAELGITVGGGLECFPTLTDISARDAQTTEIAWQMYRLGLIVTEYAWLTNEAYRLLPMMDKSIAGIAAIAERHEATQAAIRKQLAILLEDGDSVGLPDTQLADRLAKILQPQGRGFSSVNIRREIGILRQQIVAMSKENSLSGLTPSERIDGILRRGNGAPGFSWETVRHFLHKPK